MSVPVASIGENSARAYLASVADFYGRDCDVFLMNPFWSAPQKAEAERLREAFAQKAYPPAGRFFVASGGSGGQLRFVAHSPKTLEASARALGERLGILQGAPLNCFACLPPWHISGLMPYVRSRVFGGKLFVADSGRFHADERLPEFRENASGFWMNSLVPTQLRRIFEHENGPAWLRRFDFILLGGAAVPEDLIARARDENLKIGIGYGMTETASLIALWRPGESDEIAGTLLPHASVSLEEETSRIRIAAESLGETLADDGTLLPNPGNAFLTNDEGKIDASGRLRVLGRADRYINSGGEKIDPALVERALLQAGVAAAMVVGEADAEWGERVVALVVAPFPSDLLARARALIPAWMLPKRLISVPALPLDAKGKLDRAALAAYLAENN